MINLERLKVILDNHFGHPFLEPCWVRTSWGADGHLIIKIASRDIEIDEDGLIHGAGTDLTWNASKAVIDSTGMVGKDRKGK